MSQAVKSLSSIVRGVIAHARGRGRRKMYEVRYVGSRFEWCLTDYLGRVILGDRSKRKAIALARSFCRNSLEKGVLIELHVLNKKNQYTGEGSTYGSDPKKSKG